MCQFEWSSSHFTELTTNLLCNILVIRLIFSLNNIIIYSWEYCRRSQTHTQFAKLKYSSYSTAGNGTDFTTTLTDILCLFNFQLFKILFLIVLPFFLLLYFYAGFVLYILSRMIQFYIVLWSINFYLLRLMAIFSFYIFMTLLLAFRTFNLFL